MRTRPRGFTLIEIVMVITLIGILMTVGIPYFRTATARTSVQSAKSALASMHARTKAIAIQRARRTALVLDASAGTAVIIASGITGTIDTVGRVENLVQRFGVTFTTTQTGLVFSPRGVGLNTSGTTIVITKAGFADTITVSAAGRLMQ